MIVFDLKCQKGHLFEAWFGDSATFERLRKAGHVNCAVCGSAKVEKALMAPRISTRKGKAAQKDEGEAAPTASVPATLPAMQEAPAPAALSGPGRYATDPAAAKMGDLMKQLGELRTQVEKNCDYVGNDFPEEARKMHYGEVPKRNIYGEASEVEARDLAEEGIEVSRIPWAPRRNA